MKINKFIEFLSDDDESELIEFVKSHIADLIDLGFYVNIEVSYNNSDIYIIYIQRLGTIRTFKWSEISDSIIPLIKMLDKYYTFSVIELSPSKGTRRFAYNSKIYKYLMDGNFPITKYNNPKEEEDLRLIRIEDINKKN